VPAGTPVFALPGHPDTTGRDDTLDDGGDGIAACGRAFGRL
jgi:hypothetical protein